MSGTTSQPLHRPAWSWVAPSSVPVGHVGAVTLDREQNSAHWPLFHFSIFEYIQIIASSKFCTSLFLTQKIMK
jgi:hypothetical protein